MNIKRKGDATFCTDWGIYFYSGMFEPYALLPVPAQPLAPEHPFYKAHFAGIDKLITTPVAFAVLAPTKFGVDWYRPEVMVAHGWEPFAWKESAHRSQTMVQLWVRRLPERADLAKRPVPGPKRPDKYSPYKNGLSKHSDLPHMGCSTALAALDEPHAPFDLGVDGVYSSYDPSTCLNLVRCARPMSKQTIRELLKNEFLHIISLKYNQYWAKGKPGLGKWDEIEY